MGKVSFVSIKRSILDNFEQWSFQCETNERYVKYKIYKQYLESQGNVSCLMIAVL